MTTPSGVSEAATSRLWRAPGRRTVFAAVRALVPVFALVGLAASPRPSLDTTRLAAVLTVQVVLVAVTQAIAMRSRRLRTLILHVGIVGDLVAITALAALTGGAGGPLTYLYTVEAVAAGILLESRLGLRVLGVAMAAIVALDVAAAHGLVDSPAGGLQGLLAIAVLWATAGGAILFSMFNERDLRRNAAELRTIRKITLDIEDSLSIREIMADLCRGVVEGFGFSGAATLVRSGEELSCAGSHNVTGSTTRTYPVRGAVAEALVTGKPAVVTASQARDDTTLADLFGARGYVAVPLGDEGLLVAMKGRKSRRLVPRRGDGSAKVHRRELQALERLAHHAKLALGNARLHEHVSAMARTDPLTGLPNHGEFQRALAAELGRLARYSTLHGEAHHASLLLLDIDHFKAFNDLFGHQAGDEVLRGVAETVKHAVRSFDVPARYGGEELAVVLPETDSDAAVIVAERVRAAIAGWAGGPRPVTVSVGIATAPGHGEAPADLIAAADRALYESKQSGRNRATLAGRRPGVVSLSEAKSRRSPRGGRPAAGEAPRARAQSSRPTRRTPRA